MNERKDKIECIPCGSCEHETPVLLKDQVIGVDACVADIVLALNRGGLLTINSCCGHGDIPGRIVLEDGRFLIVCSHDEWLELMDLWKNRKDE